LIDEFQFFVHPIVLERENHNSKILMKGTC
jgi:hypothetical protein